MPELNVLNQKITYIKIDDEDYISITDMLKSKDGDFFVSDWLRNRNTIEFLSIWEEIHNPNSNYRIHTDAIKNNLIPKELTKNQINFVYAEEADVLNMALFGMTAKEWRTKNPNLDGNIRDYATMNELICLANLENLNYVFINEGLKQSERLEKLNKIAISQMQILNDTDIKYLK